MKATVWIVLTTAPALWTTVAAATDRVTIETALNMATASFESAAGVQLAGWQPRSETSAEKRRRQTLDQDMDLDELPTDSHRKLMPGQKPGTNLTGAPSGYDAKHLNRLWGRFSGAKTNAKADKVHKPKGGDAAVRAGRWNR